MNKNTGLVMVRASTMRPITLSPSVRLVVLDQFSAEARVPESRTALLSITGVGWKPFNSVHEAGYTAGITRVVVDDVAAGLDEEAMTVLRDGVDQATKMVRGINGVGIQETTLVVHCHAGMSRSTAFAVGCAAALNPENLDIIIATLCDAVILDGRRFIPNPLVLREFEKALGLEQGTLHDRCVAVSSDFVKWAAYWTRIEQRTA